MWKYGRHPTKLNVHLVCHTHHDPGWLKTYSQSFLGTRNDLHVRTFSLQFCSMKMLAVLRSIALGLLSCRLLPELQAAVGPHISAVQYELDGIIHGLMANRDRRYVYGEISFFKLWWEAAW